MVDRRLRRRTKAERLAARGDVRRLVRLLKAHDWLIDADGQARDLAVGQRLEAVAALGTIEGSEAEHAIVEALHDDDPRVLHAAVMALGVDAGDTAAQALARAAATWRHPSLAKAREAALDALVAMEDEVLAIVFAETLVDDDQREHLTNAEEAELRRLFDVEKGRATEVLAERLTLRLAVPDGAQGHRVHQVLVALGGVAVAPLVDALKDTTRRQPACAALAAIRDPRAVPALVSTLQDTDAATRAMAARTLGAIRDPQALEALASAANDPHPDVRDAALDALDRLGTVVDLLGAAALADSLHRRPGTIETGHIPPERDGVSPSSPRDPPPRTLLWRLLGKPPP
jgi:HEAT repeat protein